MNTDELNKLLKQNTEREQYYLDNPGSISPDYKHMKTKIIDGKEVFCFSLDKLTEKEILIRKDSRYTFVPFYIHSNINMNYIYSGECTYLINDEYITLHEGDVCIFDKDVVRAKMKTGENDIVINISMSNDFFSDSLINRIGEQSVMASFIINSLSSKENHNHYLIFQTEKSKKIIELFTSLLMEYYDNNIYSKEIIKSYLVIIFIELLRIYHTRSGNQLIQISDDSSKILMDILHYIEKNYSDCNIDDIAKTFGYHPKYISYLIKKKTGKTFNEIKLTQRLNIACSYLKNTNLSIQKIAEKVGITNQSFFYKKFEEYYKISPNNYRKKNYYNISKTPE
ncbi:AraC family transcriptional regulator [Clostridium butyricum]|uniref:AraC family transcriptional regulator n=1 Tax=Clostridium butyricum TaxID=1492 RepID=UPI000F53CA8C|nr:AraC family transcriptional regulator [Clostridium butyricum]RQN12006.1 AraC family transcriptional regulator [Clostridium butyricum]